MLPAFFGGYEEAVDHWRQDQESKAKEIKKSKELWTKLVHLPDEPAGGRQNRTVTCPLKFSGAPGKTSYWLMELV